MIRSSVRSAGLAILLSMNGCGDLVPSGTAVRTPGLNVAEAALRGGSGQIALQVSEGVLRGSPGDVRALEIKGDALVLLGSYDEAAAIFSALLVKDPRSVRANTGLGRVKLSKDPAAAEALFQLVLKRDPKDLTALNNLGIARDLQGRHAEAQTIYRQALAIDGELDSAQVNLALSMAMSGQGAAAVKLLKAKASQPGAPVKIRHDYAVVLAMAGNRAEAEKVLRENLSPDEVRQVLDNVTGTRTATVRDGAADPMVASRVGAGSPRDDVVPPDVVQVPEQPAPPVPATRVARGPVPSAGPTTFSAGPATPSMMAMRSVSGMADQPPIVVRPQPMAEPDSEMPVVQPVSPVAATLTNHRPLALFGALSGRAPAQPEPTQAPEAVLVAPEVVAVPAAPVVPVPVPTRRVTADAGSVAIPDAPPPPAYLLPASLPPASQPVARVERAPRGAAPSAAAEPTPATRYGSAMAAPVAQPVGPDSTPAAKPAAPAVAFAAPVAEHAAPSVSAPLTEQSAPPGSTQAATSASPVPAFVPSAAERGAAPFSGQAATTSAPVVAFASAVAAPVAQQRLRVAARAISATERDGAIAVKPVATSNGISIGIVPRDGSSVTLQFTAAVSEDAARSFWQDLVRRFPDALGHREPAVTRFERGGSVFWRLRAEGFNSVSEARNLCARMRAGGQDCFMPRS